MLWEDSARRVQEGRVQDANVHTVAEPIYYGYSCCFICFPSEVSFTFDSIKQFADAFLSRFEQSQKFTQDMLIDLTMQNKGKKIVNDYFNFFPNPSLSTAPSENYQYGMPPNYFAGQTPPPGSVRPSRAEPVRLVLWCSVMHHSHKLRLLLLRLIIAWSENWWILCRHIRRSHTVNHLSLHCCPRIL